MRRRNHSPSIVFVVFLVSAKVGTMPGNSVAPVGVNWTTWFCWPISDLSSCFPMRPMVHRVCMLNCVRMAKSTVLRFELPSEFSHDPLTEVIQTGAKALLRTAVLAEVSAFIAEHAHLLDEDGRQRRVRHGFLPLRELMPGIGVVPVQVPRVRDRGSNADGSKIKFRSSLVPPYLRKKSTFVLSSLWFTSPPHWSGVSRWAVQAARSRHRCAALHKPLRPGHHWHRRSRSHSPTAASGHWSLRSTRHQCPRH